MKKDQKLKDTMAEALYLLNDCNMPAYKVSKRLKLSLWKMKQLKKLTRGHLPVKVSLVEAALARKVKQVRFGKLHQRAKDIIH